jgi:hypothetical protein
MAKYLIPILTALHLTVLGLGFACAQIAADLSAPAGVGDLSADGLSADLSSENGAGASGASTAGRGMKAQSSGVSSSRSRSVTSRASYPSRYAEMMQDAPSPFLQVSPKAVAQRTRAMGISVVPIHPSGLGGSSRPTISAPRSFRSPPSALQTPVYSFLMGFEKGGRRPGASQPDLTGKPNRRRISHGSQIRLLTGNSSVR